MKDLRKLDKKRIELYEIQKYFQIDDYEELVETIVKLIEEDIITPIKNSRLNGKKPALYNRYNIVKIEEDYSKYIDELSYKLNVYLDKNYYMKNIDRYKNDREYVNLLNKFLNEKMELLKTEVSVNERSFQIWGREKFLSKEEGRRILKSLNLKEEFLNMYPTTEPLSYYSSNKNTPQKILIIENKDTFYSMRRHMIMGNNNIIGEKISTLVYGGGKNIYRTFKDFEYCVEPYLLNKKNEILYFGDLDYEGIIIYEGIYQMFNGNFNIKPFINGYKLMIDKHIKENRGLQDTKEGQNRNIKEIFLQEFNLEYRDKILTILQDSKYIPQEILNISDF